MIHMYPEIKYGDKNLPDNLESVMSPETSENIMLKTNSESTELEILQSFAMFVAEELAWAEHDWRFRENPEETIRDLMSWLVGSLKNCNKELFNGVDISQPEKLPKFETKVDWFCSKPTQLGNALMSDGTWRDPDGNIVEADSDDYDGR